jgi:hypothetical protein
MKKLLLILLAFVTISVIGQTPKSYTYDALWLKNSFQLGSKKVTGFSTDTGVGSQSINLLMTEAQIKKLIYAWHSGGPGGSSIWGTIGGSLSSQSDLVSAFSGKENALGNPSTNGYQLYSSTTGARTWAPPYIPTLQEITTRQNFTTTDIQSTGQLTAYNASNTNSYATIIGRPTGSSLLLVNTIGSWVDIRGDSISNASYLYMPKRPLLSSAFLPVSVNGVPADNTGNIVISTGGTPAFSAITGKPTTLAGYGITDAAALSHTHTFAALTSKPTTVAGYGITDAMSQSITDALYAPLGHVHTFSTLTSKPTTISGYGITDAFTQTAANALYATISHSHSFASLTTKPTTISGYGITDAEAALGNPSTSGYVLSSTSAGVRSWVAPGSGGVSAFSSLTGIPTTIAGYGLSGDAYTKTQVNSLIAAIPSDTTFYGAGFNNVKTFDGRRDSVVTNFLPSNRTVYIDSAGNDATAKVGSILYPFKSIQIALDSIPTGGIAKLSPGTFLINSAIRIKSNQSLIGSVGTIIKKNAAFTHAIVNDATYRNNGTLDSNIVIERISIDANHYGGSTGRAAATANGNLQLAYATRVQVSNFTLVNNDAGVFSTHFQSLTNSIFTDTRIVSAKDGLHLQNGCKHVRFKGGHLDTYDDAIAVLADDYAAYQHSADSIEDISFEDFIIDTVNNPTPTGFAVRLLTGSWLAWNSGNSYSTGNYVTNAGKIYKAVTAGPFTGTNAPTHTSGDVTGADGITWRYLSTGTQLYTQIKNIRFGNIRINGNRRITRTLNNDAYDYGVYPGTTGGVVDGLNFFNVTTSGSLPVTYIDTTGSITRNSNLTNSGISGKKLFNNLFGNIQVPDKLYVHNKIDIGTGLDNVNNSDSSSILTVKSTTKGVRFPAMTNAQINAIGTAGSIDVGLLVYNLDSSRYFIYNGSSWKGIMHQSDIPFYAVSGGLAYTAGQFNIGTDYTSFTGSLNLSRNGGQIMSRNMSATTDEKIWDQRASGNTYVFRAVNDANSSGTQVLTFNRSGATPTNADFGVPVKTSYGIIGPVKVGNSTTTGNSAPNGVTVRLNNADNDVFLAMVSEGTSTSYISNGGTGRHQDVVFSSGAGAGMNWIYNTGSVGVGGTPNAAALLDVASTTKGFAPPRMTSTQRGAISSPFAGLTVYCTDCTATDASTGVMTTYNGSTWKNNW